MLLEQKASRLPGRGPCRTQSPSCIRVPSGDITQQEELRSWSFYIAPVRPRRNRTPFLRGGTKRADVGPPALESRRLLGRELWKMDWMCSRERRKLRNFSSELSRMDYCGIPIPRRAADGIWISGRSSSGRSSRRQWQERQRQSPNPRLRVSTMCGWVKILFFIGLYTHQASESVFDGRQLESDAEDCSKASYIMFMVSRLICLPYALCIFVELPKASSHRA